MGIRAQACHPSQIRSVNLQDLLRVELECIEAGSVLALGSEVGGRGKNARLRLGLVHGIFEAGQKLLIPPDACIGAKIGMGMDST